MTAIFLLLENEVKIKMALTFAFENKALTSAV